MCIFTYVYIKRNKFVLLYLYVPDEGSLLPKYRDCTTSNDLELYIYIYIYIHNNVHLLTYVDVTPLMKTAGVIENSGHCIYSIGLKCFLNCFSLFYLVIYIYIYIYIYIIIRIALLYNEINSGQSKLFKYTKIACRVYVHKKGKGCEVSLRR